MNILGGYRKVLNKTENESVSSVWMHAAKELSEARYLFIIGYSFPRTDLYLRYLLGFGPTSPSRVRSVCVMNPTLAVHDEVKHLLAPALRDRFVEDQRKFSDGIGYLGGYLKI